MMMSLIIGATVVLCLLGTCVATWSIVSAKTDSEAEEKP